MKIIHITSLNILVLTLNNSYFSKNRARNSDRFSNLAVDDSVLCFSVINNTSTGLR